MLSTSGLLNRYMGEGRADKAESLTTFIEVSVQHGGEDLNAPPPELDDDVLLIETPGAYYVEPDYHHN